jgi:hypothetical protein
MMQAVLFVCLSALFALFAFAAGRAGEYVVAVAAAILGIWMGDIARHAVQRHRRRGQA